MARWSIPLAKPEIETAKWRSYRRLWHAVACHSDVVVPIQHVEGAEEFALFQLIKQITTSWKWVRVLDGLRVQSPKVATQP